MVRIFVTIFAGLLGLAFGSFLNVCLSRWPAGESIVYPGSHCRACGRTLCWWENLPLASWLALRGRCHGCGAPIHVRYPLVEAAIGGLWAFSAWRCLAFVFDPSLPRPIVMDEATQCIARMILLWLLTALAVLDAENLWLPDFLTLPGMVLGLIAAAIHERILSHFAAAPRPFHALLTSVVSMILAAGLILLIRWIYWLVRRQEGIGLGDAKLMAMLAAWLGFSGAMLSLFLGVVLGALVALSLLIAQRLQAKQEEWATAKLPLGTFLCAGGIVGSFYGETILEVYYRWAGL